MALRVTVHFSGYVAQNLAHSAGIRFGCSTTTTRSFHECIFRPRAFSHNKKTDLDPPPNYQSRANYRTSVCNTIADEIFGDGGCSSPILTGLVSLMKSTAGISSSSTTSMGIFGISPIKATSIIPFLQGSKWLPCNEPGTGPESDYVDKGGTFDKIQFSEGESDNGVSLQLKTSGSWVSKLLNVWAKMVHSALDTESKIRGADQWSSVEIHSLEHQAAVDSFSHASFELPAETIAAGDEVAATLAVQTPAEQDKELEKTEESPAEKDPFAASEAINKEPELVDGFKKNKDSSNDLTLALAGLEVTTLPPAEATQSTHINVEGFEGEYGGVAFSNEQTTMDETFEGFSDAWGGGLDASEFIGPKKIAKKEGLGGLELLQTGPDAPPPGAKDGAGTPLDNLVKKTEMKGPEMYIVEQVNAEFRESLLARVGLMGVVYLRTIPKKTSGDDKDTEFSFRVEGTSAVKRFVMQSSIISSLGNGIFHVRTAPSDEPIPILKYSLLPRLTPLPLRVRLIKRHSGMLLSVMIQYVSNPDLPMPLNDVTFALKLPVDPTLLKVSPKAVLNRSDRELKWIVPEIPVKGAPGKLKVRMPVDSSEEDGGGDMDIVCHVKFASQGMLSLSGVCLRPATEGKTDFYEVGHKYETGVYICN